MGAASSASAADAGGGGGGGGGEKKKHFPFIYGNYSGYYGYRSPSVEDARLKMLTRSMFEGKRCLDIGSNAGELTAAIARRYAPTFLQYKIVTFGQVRASAHPRRRH